MSHDITKIIHQHVAAVASLYPGARVSEGCALTLEVDENTGGLLAHCVTNVYLPISEEDQGIFDTARAAYWKDAPEIDPNDVAIVITQSDVRAFNLRSVLNRVKAA